MIEDLEEKYKCQLPLGEGSLGTLWRAEAIESGRATALAVFEPDGPDSEELCEQFLARAKVLAGLDHANVVRVFDHGMVKDGSAYMAMELLEGRSLAERLGDTPPMTIEELVEVAEQVLSGLGAVHDAGLVHGDMEPGNIFLVARGNFFFPKIIGFALSRASVRRGDGAEDDEDEGLLRSLAYMAPEQARREATIGGRSDIYSMGVILYEAIAGKLPYLASTPAAMRERVAAGGCSPLFRVKKEVAGALAGAVERAMVPDSEKRMPDAKSLRKALLSSLIVSPKLAKLALPVGPRGKTEPAGEEDEPKTEVGASPAAGPVAPPVPRTAASGAAAWKPLPPGGRATAAAPSSPKAALPPKAAATPTVTSAAGGVVRPVPAALTKRALNPLTVTDVGYPPPSATAAAATVAVIHGPSTDTGENDTLDDDNEDEADQTSTDAYAGMDLRPADVAAKKPAAPTRSEVALEGSPSRMRTMLGVQAPVPPMPKPTAVDEEELSASQILVSRSVAPGDGEDFIATKPPPASSGSHGANGKSHGSATSVDGARVVARMPSPLSSDPAPAVRDAAFPPLDDLPTQDQSAALLPPAKRRQRTILTQKMKAIPDLEIASDSRPGIPPGVWAGAGAFAGVVVLGVVALLILRPAGGENGEAPSDPGPATAANGAEAAPTSDVPVAPTPIVVETITIRLSGMPEGARIEHNGRPVLGSVIAIPRTSASDTIRVTATRCEPWQKELRPTRNEYPDARAKQSQDGAIESVEYAVTMQCARNAATERERRLEQQRAERQRAEQERAERRAAEETRTAEARAEQQRAAEQRRAEERRAAQQAEERAVQQSAAQRRAAEQRVAQQRVAQQRAAQQRAAQQRVAQQRAAQQRTTKRAGGRTGRGSPTLARDPGF